MNTKLPINAKNWILCVALVLAGVASVPAYAWYDYQHNTEDSLVWRSDNQSLELRSGQGNGIEVITVNPSTLWGLKQGDVITSVDEHPVKHVRQLLDMLYASKPAPARIHVRRGNAEQVLPISFADYTKIVNPQPPAPPVPPQH